MEQSNRSQDLKGNDAAFHPTGGVYSGVHGS